MSSPAELIQPQRPDSTKSLSVLFDKAASGDIDYYPSPVDWRDEILYFLLPDRFSDGKEDSRQLLSVTEIQEARSRQIRDDIHWGNWAESAKRWQGGTINGISSKLGYLKKLGITAIWVAPVFKQRVRKDTYHGYGIQDFLDTDPRFGTRLDLCALVKSAHEHGIRVILDVIINHSGDNWGYLPPGNPPDKTAVFTPYTPFANFYGDPNRDETRGWKISWRNTDEKGFTVSEDEILDPDDGVWPRELQNPSCYTRAGNGSLGDNNLHEKNAEHKRTDFYDLKDFALDNPGTLNHLADCFKYWIAITDCDGFRIDTVKHVSLEDARNFCGAILEFAELLGKRNFLLAGEIAGGDNNQDFVLDYSKMMQRNLKAALDIGSDRIFLQEVSRAIAPGNVYLETFKEDAEGFDSHRSFGNRHISILDDHDHVMGEKIRFSAYIRDDSPVKEYAVVVPTAIQLLTLGIPCIYYGSEQAFAGPPQSQLGFVPGWKDPNNWGDRYLREAMFGPDHPRAGHANDIQTQLTEKDTALPGFAAFGITGKHCFNEKSPAYIRMAALAELRKSRLILRTGRQYTRMTSVIGKPFSLPEAGELMAWTRILDDDEIICIVNPNLEAAFRGADVQIGREIFRPGQQFRVILNTAQVAAEAAGLNYTGTHPVGSSPGIRFYDDGNIAIVIREVQRAEVLVIETPARS